uniref:HMG-box containing 3 n=1 Tax=Leptobrachium leishanense TaxID=445787 RepID=A0A8C5QBA1_9ANUR
MEAQFDGTEVTVVSEEIEGNEMPSKPPVRKKRYKASAEHGDNAKKPRSAYLLYYYDIYLKVQQEVPHMPQSEINKKISESWKLLSVAEKSYYLERAKLEKEGIDPSITSSTPSMVSDIPGFRKILPRSDYILIHKRSPGKAKAAQQQMEICVTQPQETAITTPSCDVSHNGEQNVLSLDAGQISLSEQCIDMDGLTEEAVSFTSADVVQERLLGGVFSNYNGPTIDKSVDVILDDAMLEIGETSPYQAANMVFEDNGGISLAQSDIPAGLSVLTVMAIQDTEENVQNPTSHYFMFPMASRPAETPRPVKLASTYTRRGRGNCTNPTCTFSYVTRHKPPKCPLCDNFLGGKWVPKTKQVKEKCPPTTKTTTELPDNPVEDRCSSALSGSKSSEENKEAVSQLLHASSPAHGEEWEEVIITDVHILSQNTGESHGGIVFSQEQSVSLEVETTEKMECDDPQIKESSAEHVTCQVSSTKGDVTSPSTTHKGQETKYIKPRATSLAAARPIRAILPAPSSASRSVSAKCVNGGLTIIKTETHKSINSSGLKPSTLKQLGHSVLPQQLTPEIMIRSDPQGPISQPQLKVVSEAFSTYKVTSPVSLDLGLATQRGRGKCKNPLCSFMYTNRHKPKTCPNCGSSLTKNKMEKGPRCSASSHDTKNCVQNSGASEPLTQTQKETQRQSTLQLLRKTVQIPENECELSEVIVLIQDLNRSRLVLSNVSDGTVTIEQTSWASFYESSATHCLLCGTILFKGENSVAGQQDCWLLTTSRLQLVTAQLKMCLNMECLAIHSFNDISTGLFNVGNKLLVSLDILFSIRNQIKLGNDPRVSIGSILDSVQEHAEKGLNPEEVLSVYELLNCGYWAFECLTVRDFNDMICGVCGVAPKVEVAQRNAENTLTLTNVEFTWPGFLTSNEVSMEDFWATLENEVLEQALFPSSVAITKFDASIVSPFYPPLMRAPVVVNSESYKNLEVQKVPGNGSALVKLFQEGNLKLDELNLKTEEELRNILNLCGIPCDVIDTKDQMCYSVLALSEFVQNGTQTKQPPPHLTGGKLYKVCPHQVICGSKYIVHGESPRDHVDLLASSRHWPPVYVVDIATQVSLCADLCYSSLTQQMWGMNQGCFSDPTIPPKYVSCPELLDRHYNVDITENESSILHPATKSASRRVVHAGGKQNGTCDPTSRHHSLTLCRELEPYSAIITAIGDSKTSNIRHLPINFENPTHYYLYNRLIDFLTSREIVNRQIHDIVQNCQPGEVVIRDTLYRLGVAQIKTEILESELEEDTIQDQQS